MIVFYHTTLKQNKTSILSNGLLSKIGARSKEIGEIKKAVYLFNSIDDLDNALSNWLGEYYEDNELSTFIITIPLDFTTNNFTYDPDHYESISFKDIPSQYVQFLRED